MNAPNNRESASGTQTHTLIYGKRMQLIRRLLRRLLPGNLAQRINLRRAARFKRAMSGRPSDEIFAEIYKQGMWGGSASGRRYYSGRGSHLPEIVEPYIDAASRFLDSFDTPPDVADLGCGDFAVGSRLRHKCNHYTAYDIVADLITYNRSHFADLNVDFRALNLATGDIASGDVAFIRQVLQHMSNAEISALLEKIDGKFRYLVITEQLPGGAFTPNIDKAPGADIRVAVNSGVVLTAPPFLMAHSADQVLCEVREGPTIVRTNLYRMP